MSVEAKFIPRYTKPTEQLSFETFLLFNRSKYKTQVVNSRYQTPQRQLRNLKTAENHRQMRMSISLNPCKFSL